ncbi:MAG: MurR/RpiR family transcriptional regulator [Rhodobacteraceae bacterium]|nr:MurR/RpiR family transcriptional regulator [Paracoccaceae bacterium]
MNGMNVPNTAQPASHEVLTGLAGTLDSLTPELRKAAAYVLENPNDVGISSIREIADAAKVKPNTFVRMARTVGFDGYEDFREPFRDEIRKGGVSFPDRARWLQSLAKGGALSGLYADMVAAAISNIEDTFAGITDKQFTAAATDIWASRHVYTLGVGVNNSNALNFTYLAGTGMESFYAIPRPGSAAIDDLAHAGTGDTLIAMTCKPYRREVVEAVELAREQEMRIVAISDSPASPIIIGADHGFVISADTPQFFPTSVSTIAVLETLLSFVIATADPKIVKRVEKFHARRHALGLYVQEQDQ